MGFGRGYGLSFVRMWRRGRRLVAAAADWLATAVPVPDTDTNTGAEPNSIAYTGPDANSIAKPDAVAKPDPESDT